MVRVVTQETRTKARQYLTQVRERRGRLEQLQTKVASPTMQRRKFVGRAGVLQKQQIGKKIGKQMAIIKTAEPRLEAITKLPTAEEWKVRVNTLVALARRGWEKGGRRRDIITHSAEERAIVKRVFTNLGRIKLKFVGMTPGAVVSLSQGLGVDLKDTIGGVTPDRVTTVTEITTPAMSLMVTPELATDTKDKRKEWTAVEKSVKDWATKDIPIITSMIDFWATKRAEQSYKEASVLSALTGKPIAPRDVSVPMIQEVYKGLGQTIVPTTPAGIATTAALMGVWSKIPKVIKFTGGLAQTGFGVQTIRTAETPGEVGAGLGMIALGTAMGVEGAPKRIRKPMGKGWEELLRIEGKGGRTTFSEAAEAALSLKKKKGKKRIVDVEKAVKRIEFEKRLKELPKKEKFAKLERIKKDIETSFREGKITSKERAHKLIDVKILELKEKGHIVAVVDGKVTILGQKPTLEVYAPLMVGGTKPPKSLYAGTGYYERTDVGSTQILPTKTKTFVALDIKTDVATKPKQDLSYKFRQLQAPATLTKLEQKPRTEQVPKIITKTRGRTKLGTAQQLAPLTRQVPKTKTKTKTKTRTTTKPFILPRAKLSGLSKKKKVKIKKKGEQAFEVQVKRFGQFKTIGAPLPKGKALKKGATVTKATLAATFRIVPKGITTLKDIKFKPSAKVYRAPKRKVTPYPTYIERRGFRLSTGSEVSEIKTAKRRKRR